MLRFMPALVADAELQWRVSSRPHTYLQKQVSEGRHSSRTTSSADIHRMLGSLCRFTHFGSTSAPSNWTFLPAAPRRRCLLLYTNTGSHRCAPCSIKCKRALKTSNVGAYQLKLTTGALSRGEEAFQKLKGCAIISCMNLFSACFALI